MRYQEILKNEKQIFTCKWCKKEFESEFGKFCPHCSRFQDPVKIINEAGGFDEWFAGSKIVDQEGNPLPVYHGTNKQFDKFSFENAAQRIIWFSSNRNKIERGESGAASSTIIKTAYLKITNPAGWEEYEPLTLDQIESEGYDGIILDDDYVVFSPEQVWIVE